MAEHQTAADLQIARLRITVFQNAENCSDIQQFAICIRFMGRELKFLENFNNQYFVSCLSRTFTLAAYMVNYRWNGKFATVRQVHFACRENSNNFKRKNL